MNNMPQEQFDQLDDYNKYVTQYQNLLDCDDGSWQSSQHITHWLNHTAHDTYGEQCDEYYQRMMIEFYDHTPEDFMD